MLKKIVWLLYMWTFVKLYDFIITEIFTEILHLYSFTAIFFLLFLKIFFLIYLLSLRFFDALDILVLLRTGKIIWLCRALAECRLKSEWSSGIEVQFGFGNKMTNPKRPIHTQPSTLEHKAVFQMSFFSSFEAMT